MPKRAPMPEDQDQLNAAIFLCAMSGYCVLDVTTLSDEQCLQQIRMARQAAKERAEEEGNA